MRARWQLAAAARELRPLRQGELDGLCGLYSIINALRLAIYPKRLRKPEIKLLFEAGLRALATTRRLRVIVVDGMGDETWARMADAVLSQLELSHGQRLTLDDLLAEGRVQSMTDAHRSIRQNLRVGRPVIVTLEGSYDHWTVLSSDTKSRYYLFDSWGYRWVGANNVALADDAQEAAHCLARALALHLAI